MNVQNGSAAPEGGKARRIYLLLRDEIMGGTHAPGSALPGELRLAETHGVSRVTIRRALDALVGDGLVERRAGSGTVVRRPSTQPVQLRADFATLMPQLQRMADATTARLLSFAYVNPPAMVAEALNIAAGERVQRAVRLRLADDKAFSHLTTFVPENIAQSYSEADLASTPLFRLLERRGVRIGNAHQTVSAVLATPDTAEALETTVGAALIALTRVVYDSDGAGIEYLSALYRPDRFQLEMTLNRVGGSDDRHWEPVFGEAAQRTAK
ncbi:GntR family transcriptional regulator [Chachezhania sediminis]|uniref:GntR family transcriptional regulator n=1 Tax=Chachezhania sediminis TaxID=2599291 RepID=UPI00131C69FE|nr:GntR family transcriptional regulator [Chachezhania sediminis]